VRVPYCLGTADEAAASQSAEDSARRSFAKPMRGQTRQDRAVTTEDCHCGPEAAFLRRMDPLCRVETAWGSGVWRARHWETKAQASLVVLSTVPGSRYLSLPSSVESVPTKARLWAWRALAGRWPWLYQSPYNSVAKRGSATLKQQRAASAGNVQLAEDGGF
jgi:hypothetical protein